MSKRSAAARTAPTATNRTDLLTREELAESFGVGPLTVDDWVSKGMPCVSAGDSKPSTASRPTKSWEISRRDLARQWNVHEDTVSKWLPHGLGAAITRRRAKGELMLDLRVAARWRAAAEGKLNQMILDDFKVYAAAGVFALHALSIAPMLTRRDEN